jgi:hypothetical protein
MKINKFYEKVGKLTFSLVLTWILATGIVIAWTTWQTYTDDDTISGSQWQLMVTEIQNKVSAVDIPDFSTFYTKSEIDTTFVTPAEVIESVMNTCKICIAQGDRNNQANFSNNIGNNRYTCSDFWSIGKLDLIWDVNSDDQLAFKIECGIPGTWSAAVSTTFDWECGPRLLSNAEKSWFCSKDNWSNIYYKWETTCNYEWSLWNWEPIMLPWYDYTHKETQTCE